MGGTDRWKKKFGVCLPGLFPAKCVSGCNWKVVLIVGNTRIHEHDEPRKKESSADLTCIDFFQHLSDGNSAKG